MNERKHLAVRDTPDGTTVCGACHHPIEHFAQVGWVDMVPAARGGTYDFCTTGDGRHVPETPTRR